MAAIGLPLCVHGEVTDPEVDIFDREAVFIDRVLAPLRGAAARSSASCWSTSPPRTGVALRRGRRATSAATITVHHLILNRNHLLVGGIRPHYYCLPVVKRERHRAGAASRRRPAATRASSSAPTARRTRRRAKEAACGCAGVFTAPVALACLAQVFEEEGALDRLEALRQPERPGLLPAAAERGADHARARRRRRSAAPAAVETGAGPVVVFDPGLSAALARARLKGAPMFANGFPPDAEMARLTARMLLEIRAVHFRRDEPYKLTSGLASPVYIDCRKLISYPAVRAALMDFACAKLLRDAGFAPLRRGGGRRDRGHPLRRLDRRALGLPMLYVRKKPKGFGRDAQIEGAMAEGARVLLVEDLTTDGGSKLRFAEAIRAAGGEVRAHLRRLLLRHLPAAPRRRWPGTGCSCTISPPGATCWPRRARARISTPRRSTRSRPSSARRSTGRRRMAASPRWWGKAAGAARRGVEPDRHRPVVHQRHAAFPRRRRRWRRRPRAPRPAGAKCS